MTYFIINGRGGSGKDLFVDLCAKHVGAYMCFNVSTVDRVKEIAKFCGWEGGKDEKDRKFLSDLKQLLADYSDLPHQSVLRQLALYKADLEKHGLNPDNAIAFIHCREPEAIERLRQELDAVTVLIRRPCLENHAYGNASDDGVEHYHYNFTIFNDGTIEDLECWAVALLAANNVKIIN